MIESRRHIYSSGVCYFLCQCIAVSIIYFGSGFAYTFNDNLLGKYSDSSLVSFAKAFGYPFGALLCGFFISRGRRMVLIVVDVLCICILPLLIIGDIVLDVVLCMVINVINGVWVVSTFVYGKDISVAHQPAFIATFLQAVNSVGLVLGSVAKLLVEDLEGDDQKFVTRLFIGISLGICCLYQLIAFATYMKDEPIKYVHERYGEESSYQLVSEIISDRPNVERTMQALQTASLYKKFKGVNFMSIFNKYYRKAFIVCLTLLLFKCVHHVLKFDHRIPKKFESKDSSKLLKLINAITKTILVFGALLFINKITRKRLLFIGYSLYAIGHALCTIIITISLYFLEISEVMVYLLLISIIFTEWVAYALLTYMPYVLVLELLPDKGVAFMIALYSVNSSFNQYISDIISKNETLKWSYYPLMALVCYVALIFIEFFVEDTSDTTEEGTKKAYFEKEDDTDSERPL